LWDLVDEPLSLWRPASKADHILLRQEPAFAKAGISSMKTRSAAVEALQGEFQGKREVLTFCTVVAAGRAGTFQAQSGTPLIVARGFSHWIIPVIPA
jgi:hypothetical protein